MRKQEWSLRFDNRIMNKASRFARKKETLHINYEGRIFDLTLSETETVCVKVPANALIFLAPASLGTEGVGEGSVEFDYLTEEDEVEALGYYDATDCFVVDTLWIEVEGDIVIEE